MKGIVAEESGAYLSDLLELPFTKDQLAIAAHPLSPQLVVAGAGSGKTMVMAARVVHLVAFHGVPPSEILGLTFTNKAAGELAERVRRALSRLTADQLPGDDDLVDDQPTVSTYHAYAASIVRDHALRIGREPVTQLLTEASRWQLALRVVRNARGPYRHLTWTPANVARYLLNLDAEMAEHMATAAEVRDFDSAFIARVESLAKPITDFTKCADAARARDELLELVEGYRESKRDLDLIDYGDQVALAAEIAIRAPDVPRMERDRFRVVLLDEYQDTGVAQRLLLSALFGKGHPVTAVGDPHQAIYGWRGASVGNLLRFPEHFPSAEGAPPRVQPLMTSFRSGGRILAIANAVARLLLESVGARRRPRVDVPELGPKAGAELAGETRIALLHTINEEAGWVAEQVATALAADDTSPRDVAVLCRRRADFALLHDALTSRGVPVEVVGLGGLLTMPEVADVVATLRVLADPIANPELLRLLTGPRWRIGPRDLAALGERARSLASTPREEGEDPTDADAALRAATEGVDVVDVVSLSDALDSLGPPGRYSPEAHARLVAFRDELRGMRPLITQPIVEMVAEVVRRIGLDVEIEAAGGAVAGARAANLGAFLDHAAGFTGLQGESDLPAFLAYLDAAADEENGLDVGGVSAADTVKLLTVHKAKGLEWAVVAVPGLSVDVFPSGQGRERWTTRAHVLPYALRGDVADLPGDPELTREGLKAFEGDCTAESADEERRLGYVAFTRAKRLLLASGYWWGATQVKPKGASPLLEELHALAGKGLATVDRWVPNSAETNPNLGVLDVDVTWPVPYEPAAYSRRLAAAERVRAAMVASAPASGVGDGVAEDWRREAELLLAELRETRSPVREVALPRRLTASQVVMLAEDPDELARVLARPMPMAPGRQARRGTRFHAWVESLFAERPLLDADEVPGAADAQLDVTDEELAELQRRFIASSYGDKTPVAIEAPFELVVGGRLVRGRIDAVYSDGDGYDVIDYKTGEVPRDFAAASLQLSCYRLAWAGIKGIDPSRVTAGFLYVKTGTVKRPEQLLSADELASLLSNPA